VEEENEHRFNNAQQGGAGSAQKHVRIFNIKVLN